MLRVSKLGPGRSAYYFGPEPFVDPATSARWAGAGAAALGLVGAPTLEQMLRLEAGRHPTGDVLGAHHDRVRVAGFDLTFCAPKSVSLLHTLADAEVGAAVLGAHRSAVAAALGYVERRALAVRRGSGADRVVEPTLGAPAGVFEHATSRVLDPHLHSHVVVANLGADGAGRWSALDGRGVYAHAGASAALYHATLRHELTARLGVAWGPLDRGRADIEGVGPEVRRAFSRRSVAIEAHVEGLARPGGVASRRAVELAAHATRPAKDASRPADELTAEWRARATELGFGARRLEAVLGRVPAGRAAGRDEATVADERAVAWLVDRGRAVARRDVVRAVGGALGAGAPAAEVERRADALLGRLTGPGHEPGVGVSETRRPLADLALDAGERRRLARVLEQRAERGRRQETGRALGADRGYDVGLGIG